MPLPTHGSWQLLEFIDTILKVDMLNNFFQVNLFATQREREIHLLVCSPDGHSLLQGPALGETETRSQELHPRLPY